MIRHRTFVMVLIGSVLLSAGTALADSKSIKLNCSEGYWYPFLYTQDNQERGLMYDIVSKALESLGIKADFEPLPIRRAIFYAQEGEADGVIVDYHPDLAELLDYPPDADKDVESPWRIMQVDNVVVSVAEDPYEFEGDLKTLPLPVRVLRESAIIADLNNAGKVVEDVSEDIQNFQKLLRDKRGVIITTTVIAEMMDREPLFKGKIKIHATPVDSVSYYLAFSKKSSLSSEDKERIWKEIARWRDDYIFMLQMFSQY